MPLPLSEFHPAQAAAITCVFTDIDDTLTTGGRLTATAYQALEHLHDAGLKVIPVTGRPAGWCDHIARMWPVDAVIGENGAFYMRYDGALRRMHTRFMACARDRAAHRRRLAELGRQILEQVPGCALASDQDYRAMDLAIDFCEDVPPLGPDQVARIVSLLHAAGATAKVSSIHVNGWFGGHDKLSMTRIYAQDCLDADLDKLLDACVYVGDSPNDAPMFGFFPNAVGVANVRRFLGQMDHPPRYVTQHAAGEGFAELSGYLLACSAGHGCS